MKVEFDIASDQIDGARDYQEDAYMVNQLGESESGDLCSLIVMADGMGGHAAGNIASNMVVATFNKTFQGHFPTSEVSDVLTDALNRSNDQIRASVKETPALRGMGCTMVSAYLEDANLYWVSVGDSHLYLVRDRELIKQNADHSYGAYLDMMKEQGMEIEEQAGMSRNMLMSAMTGEEISSIDVSETPIKVRPGDRIIIASDGLDTLGDGAIIQYSSWSATAKECVYALLKAVEDANKINQDNTTLIVVDIKERETRSAPDPVDIEAPAEPVAPVAEVPVKDHYKEPRSFKWLIWLVVLAALGGGGFYAWQQGLLSDAMDKGTELVDSTTKSIEAELAADPKPEPVVTPEPEPAPEPAPEPDSVVELEPEPEPEPVETAKAEMFRDQLKGGGYGPTMINVPAGTFLMGASSSVVGPDEVPRHQVTISSFAVGVYEVTFDEYYRFARATGRKKPKDNGWDRKTHPVIDVSWDDALAYTRWLSKQTGKSYRLLSESEWEYVARAGTTRSFWWGSKAGTGNAHCFDCKSDFSTSKPAKVGTYKPNPFGLYDTAGNVFEWVHDCYHRNYQNAPTDGSVWEGGDCDVRITRGGAYRSPADSMRVENRDKFKSNKGQYNVGFRVARDL
jgi:formylglycine-generating enzyme required for sulfatase activity/serine/threonine protein phosphatase PrpC